MLCVRPCSSFCLFAHECVCLSLRDRCKDLAIIQLAAHVGPTTRGRKRRARRRKNKIKYIFMEDNSNWSRNNLIAPPEICLDFQGLWNYGGEQRAGANDGGEEGGKRVFSLVCGWTWWSINEQRQGKKTGNGKGALISRVIIKRRDPLKRPISN